MKKQSVILLLAAFLSGQALTAQSVVASAGGQAVVSGVSLSWTLGEPVISTFTNARNVLTQGFHQSRLGTASLDDIPVPGLILTVYPNPGRDLIHLRVESNTPQVFRYALLDISGRLLQSEPTAGSETGIDLRDYPPGYYLLQVRRSTGEVVKSFKVAKY